MFFVVHSLCSIVNLSICVFSPLSINISLVAWLICTGCTYLISLYSGLLLMMIMITCFHYPTKMKKNLSSNGISWLYVSMLCPLSWCFISFFFFFFIFTLLYVGKVTIQLHLFFFLFLRFMLCFISFYAIFSHSLFPFFLSIQFTVFPYFFPIYLYFFIPL